MVTTTSSSLRATAVLCLSFLLSPASSFENLLTYQYGQTGMLLGSQFGLPGTNATYDYVIVGGGTGGLAIATRLAQNRSVSVAVIEAGGFYEIDNGNYSIVPGYANFYTGADPDNYQPLVDWGFSTVPQAVSRPGSRCWQRDLTKPDRGLETGEYIMRGERLLEARLRETIWYTKGAFSDTEIQQRVDMD